jgi:hypothetical protein
MTEEPLNLKLIFHRSHDVQPQFKLSPTLRRLFPHMRVDPTEVMNLLTHVSHIDWCCSGSFCGFMTFLKRDLFGVMITCEPTSNCVSSQRTQDQLRSSDTQWTHHKSVIMHAVQLFFVLDTHQARTPSTMWNLQFI